MLGIRYRLVASHVVVALLCWNAGLHATAVPIYITINERESGGETPVEVNAIGDWTMFAPRIAPPATPDTADLIHSDPEQRYWSWGFPSLDDALDFLSDNWEVHHRHYEYPYSGSGPTPPVVLDRYQLQIDPIAIPANARSAGTITSPSGSTQVRPGEWIDIQWTFPDGPIPGNPLILAEVSLEDVTHTFRSLVPPNLLYGGSGTITAGSFGDDRSLKLEYSTVEGPEGRIHRQRITPAGFALPGSIGYSVGSMTEFGPFGSELVEGSPSSPLEFETLVIYSYLPDPTLYVAMVPEPSSQAVAALCVGIAVVGLSGWRRNRR